ncbi:hypothetical protein ACVB8X_06855 [Streptomyces sp. NRAIS4]
MVAYARTLRTSGVPVPQIARKLVIPSGKNKGEHPLVASVYRVLAEAEATDATTEHHARGPDEDGESGTCSRLRSSVQPTSEADTFQDGKESGCLQEPLQKPESFKTPDHHFLSLFHLQSELVR